MLLSSHLQTIPSHGGHFVFVTLRTETFHIHIEDADAIHVTFFRMAAQQLLSDADSQYRLLQRSDHLRQTVGMQVFHGAPCLSLSWKDHMTGMAQYLRVVGEHRLNAQSSDGVHHGIDVSCIIFYDSYVHFDFFLL